MTKTFSKVLAVILSLAVLFAVPVMANAEETTFALTGSIYGVEGDWDDDYVQTIAIEVKGEIANFAEGAVVSVGTGAEVANILTAKIADIGYALTPGGGSAVVIINFNNYINHAETYNFYFAEGTFVSEDGKNSAELTVSVTGNDIIEALDVEHVSTKPIEKLIDWMYTWGAEGIWLDLIDFIVSILEWFLYI